MTAPNLGSTRFGKVIFRVVAGIADGPDANVLPDALPVTGFGVLTPRIERIIDHGDGTSPAQLVLPRPVRVTMVNGNLTYRGDPWVWLIASEPGVWRWHAQFTYKVGTETLTDEFLFDLPDGDPEDPDYEPTNLATARVLTDPSTGVPTVVGPPGRSVVDVQLLPNGLLFVMSREGDIEVEIPSLGDLAQAAVDAAASATAAANSAQESSSAASAAASSAAGAAASATTAATMAADASDAATTATTKASEAAAAASTADTRATAASNSATAAAGSASTASTKAAEAADSAAAAAGSASTAATAASTATTKASDAASSASSAAGSASTASTKADEAAASAATADARATTASTAASTATTKAGEASTAASTATTKAADAASAATTATTKAGDAAAAATAAEGASTAAAGSASAAATRAGEAASSATTAAGSATTATTKASEAAASAAAAAQSAIDAASVVTDGIPNASPTVKGGIKLAGDLDGTADLPRLADAARLDTVRDIRGFQHWHDLLAFGVHIPFPVQERSVDGGATWVEEPVTAALFDTKEYLSTVVLNEPAAVAEKLRMTWSHNNLSYCQGRYFYLVPAYTTGRSFTITVERSTDGVSWETVTEQTASDTTTAVIVDLGAAWSAHTWCRLILSTVPGSGTGQVRLTSIRFLSARKGSQGSGWERSVPYDWDSTRKMYFEAVCLKKGSDGSTPAASGFVVTSANTAGDLRYEQAHAGNEPGTIMRRNSSGNVSISDPTAASHAATKNYVDGKVAGLVDSAPTTLDTLNELAAALNDDPNFATTMATQIGQKADLEHDHTIADVTGLAEALESAGGSGLDEVVATYTSGDFTALDFSVPGNYRVRTGSGYVTNGPSTSTLWWNVFVVNAPDPAGANTTLFFATTTSTGNLYSRTKYGSTWGGWVTLNAPFSAMSLAEGIAGSATSTRAMRPDYLKQIINHWITGDQNAVTSEIGKALALAADPAAAREVIDAAAEQHEHLPADVTGLVTALEAKADLAGGKVLAGQLAAGGTDGQVLAKAGTGAEWIDPPEGGGGGLDPYPTSRIMTYGNGGMGQTVAADLAAATQHGIRIPVKLFAPTLRWRLKLRNYNMTNAARNPLTCKGVILGTHASDGNFTGSTAQTLVPGDFTIPGNGNFWYSPWITDPALQLQEGVEYLIGLGYTLTSQAMHTTIGQCWRWTTAAAALDPATTGGTVPVGIPLDFQIEYEVATDTHDSAWLVLADSIQEGVTGPPGTSTSNVVPQPIHTAPPQRWAQAQNILVQNISMAGMTASVYAQTTSFPEFWSRQDMVQSHIDGILISLGSNDASSSRTLAQFQADMTTIVQKVRSIVGYEAPLYLGTVMPRNALTTAQNNLRIAYNDWIKTLPLGAAGFVDFDQVMKSGGTSTTALQPAYTNDNIHPSYEGQQVLADKMASIPTIVTRRERDEFERMTQAQYDALAVRDPNKLYLIRG